MFKKLFSNVILVLVGGAIVDAGFLAAQSDWGLKAESVMTPQELKDSGLSSLNLAQKRAFDEWLNRYTAAVFAVALTKNTTEPAAARPTESAPPARSEVSSRCAPAIESNLAGEFNGWEGETMFKLDNGQIWEQAEYAYTYSYSYRPDVTIYQVSGGCRLKVEDEDETILVRRIK